LRGRVLGQGQRGRIDRRLHGGLDGGGAAVVHRGPDQSDDGNCGEGQEGKDARAAVVQKPLEQHGASPSWNSRRADYASSPLPFRCPCARFSPPPQNGFITKNGTKRACVAVRGGGPMRVGATAEAVWWRRRPLPII